jgi:hypothetical protein
MCPNVLTIIRNIAEFRNNDLRSYSSTYLNRINAVGQQLEFYVKDAVCNSFKLQQNEKEAVYTKGALSWRGNQNNPPDFIINGGDSYEIKKIQSLKSSLALNNSPPKDRLYQSDPRIIKDCRSCEGGNWSTKETFYVVGSVQESKIKYLFLVHGRCYAAEKEVYEGKASRLKKGIEGLMKLEGWEASTTTTELGRINRMDPLGITNFRIRGMWEIENPIKVFSYVYSLDTRKDFSLIALMAKAKYDSFPQEDIIALENDKRISTKSVKIKNPNNPAQLMDAELITSWW